MSQFKENCTKCRIIFIYLLIGIGLGIIFPVIAVFFELYINKLNISLENIKNMHKSNPLLFIIDTAPFFLGFVSFIAGINQAKSEENQMKLETIAAELQASKEQLLKLTKKLEKDNKDLYEISITDKLTRLYNRRYTLEQLEFFVKSGSRYNWTFSIIMCDIDHFKNINDNFGHLYGDKVLREISKSLKDSLRESDIIGRYGGEEFLIILHEADLENAKVMTERLRKTIESMKWENPDKITMSFGIAEFNNESGFEPLLIRADNKLYEAKKVRNKIEG